MPLINCEISLQLKWSKDCILVTGTAANQNPKFQINDTKIYVPVVRWQDGIKDDINSRWHKTPYTMGICF